jgi:hypothetical protein
MSCCGKSRVQFTGAPSKPWPLQASTRNLTAQIPVQHVGTVTFEYTGKTRLTVIGPVTRLRYDFVGHGARMQVDHRDSPALACVAGLRRV